MSANGPETDGAIRSANQALDNAIPERLGRFKIERELGRDQFKTHKFGWIHGETAGVPAGVP